jgi:hypothetical protein
VTAKTAGAGPAAAPVSSGTAVPTPTTSHEPTAEFNQTEQEAVELHRRGIEAFKAGKYLEARTLYERSLALVPHYQTAALLGQVEAALGHPADAAYYFALSLSLVPPDADPSRSRDALTEAKQNVHSLRVLSVPSEVSISVDGLVTRGVAQEGALDVYLTPGQHTLMFAERGYEPQQTTLDAGKGTSQLLQVALQLQSGGAAHTNAGRDSASVLPPKPVSERPAPAALVQDLGAESHLERFWPVYVGGVATLAAVGVGTYFGIEARRSDGDLGAVDARTIGPDSASSAQCASNSPLAASPACGELNERAQKRDRQYTISVGGFVAAGVLGAATLGTYFWLTRDNDSTRVTPVVGLNRVELLVHHEF